MPKLFKAFPIDETSGYERYFRLPRPYSDYVRTLEGSENDIGNVYSWKQHGLEPFQELGHLKCTTEANIINFFLEMRVQVIGSDLIWP